MRRSCCLRGICKQFRANGNGLGRRSHLGSKKPDLSAFLLHSRPFGCANSAHVTTPYGLHVCLSARSPTLRLAPAIPPRTHAHAAAFIVNQCAHWLTSFKGVSAAACHSLCVAMVRVYHPPPAYQGGGAMSG